MLILVRHALPIIQPGHPAAEWQLSEDGRIRTRELAEKLRAYQPDIVVASQKPRAAETGRIVADLLGLPYETAENLHEHERGSEFVSRERFQEQIEAFFERPTELVFGLETAEQALERFESAVSQVIGRHPNKNIILATHGTVITLFVAAHNPDIAPLPFWQQLQMPDYIMLRRPSFKLPL
ncbi:MAG: histidine phosphatase family protein [Candidatus Promineifilaceae bacterium]